MHYYTWNIGDYSSHASHLTPIEDVAYRRLLDKYYLSETPICLDIAIAARSIGMREYQSEVEVVIREFFTQGEFGWVNKRAEQEIAHYKGKIDQASKAGKASAEARFNARSTSVQRTSNQPITNNQQPITNNQHKAKDHFTVPDWIPEPAWQGFLESRKASKGAFTDRAKMLIINQLKTMQAEGQDVGAVLDQSVANGWKGVFPLKTQQGSGNGKFNIHQYTRNELSKALEQGMAREVVDSSPAQEVFSDLPPKIHQRFP